MHISDKDLHYFIFHFISQAAYYSCHVLQRLCNWITSSSASWTTVQCTW